MLVLLASLYEELEYASDPTDPKVHRAKLLFNSQCRRIYEEEAPSLRKEMSLEKYVAASVIPDVLRQIESPPAAPNI